MDTKWQEEFGELFARLADLSEKADRGMPGITPFLTPREEHYAASYLNRHGIQYIAYGGYAEAERKKIYLLPSYMELPDGVQERPQDFDVCSFFSDFGYQTNIAVTQIVGSGYRMLNHRDFLGALLGMGLQRNVLGDILICDENGQKAILFCEETIVPFLEQELIWVANDKVRLMRLTEKTVKVPPKRFLPIRDTIASPRLDCVIAALCGLSREKAKGIIESGVAEVNYESAERPERTVVAPSLISVRGFGRYRILSLTDRTKKGRLRLEAEQYI